MAVVERRNSLVAGGTSSGKTTLSIALLAEMAGLDERVIIIEDILNSFPRLTDIIFRSFDGLGLTAGGSTINAADLLMPGRLAGTGFEAARPLRLLAMELVGPIEFFNHFIEIAVLFIPWLEIGRAQD